MFDCGLWLIYSLVLSCPFLTPVFIGQWLWPRQVSHSVARQGCFLQRILESCQHKFFYNMNTGGYFHVCNTDSVCTNINIARGTTDPEIDSETWTKLGNNIAPLALIANLANRWRHLTFSHLITFSH